MDNIDKKIEEIIKYGTDEYKCGTHVYPSAIKAIRDLIEDYATQKCREMLEKCGKELEKESLDRLIEACSKLKIK